MFNQWKKKYYIYPFKQHVDNTAKFGMHENENMCACGIWKWATLGRCYWNVSELICDAAYYDAGNPRGLL